MADRTQPYTPPPTSPKGEFIGPKSPNSPRSFHTLPFVPRASGGTRLRHPTPRVDAPPEILFLPATLDIGYAQGKGTRKKVLLELADGSSYTGFSFGAAKSISGELVFQTGKNPYLDFNFHSNYH